jgi:hypothetical protein
VHRVDLIEKVSDSPASTNDGTEAGHITADGDIIPQDSNSVKSKFSDRSTNTVSNRTLLAEALEGFVAPTDLCIKY